MGLFVRTIERQRTLDPISEGDAGRSWRRRHRLKPQPRSGSPTSSTIYGRPPPQGVLVPSAALDAQIYPACRWSGEAPGLDGDPLPLTSSH
ncbi:MAG TPA: hypothetical protein VHL31_14545, partial [Geminicoccus sp.]|uniref:hypothetical protein n=1 Tax=Geminicoccus sp. TaxID=2024832 RepID=UPI002E3643FB